LWYVFDVKRRPVTRNPQRQAGGDYSWLLIFAAVFVAYLPALNGGVLWDDLGHITLPELRSFEGLWRIWTEVGATQQYYPMLHSAFWLEHRLWGDSMAGYHLANVALHSAAAFLLVLILRTLNVSGALLAGLIFALHPVAVESVAWISEQKNTLSAVFYLASAYLYLRDRRFPPPRSSRYWLAFVLFICALLSKTVTATLPAALLVVVWWRDGRLDWRRHVLPLIPWFAVAAFAGAFTIWFEHNVIGARGAQFALSFIERLLLSGRVIWFYLGKIFWPTNLNFMYPRWTIDASVPWQYLYPIAAVALAIALGAFARRPPAFAPPSPTAAAFAKAPADRRSLGGGWSAGRRGPLAGYLFFVGTLVPVLGFVNVFPFVFSYVADHFQYLAALGVIVPFASVLAMSTERLGPALQRIFAAALVVVLGLLTWNRSAVYRDAETLYRDVIARNPASWMAYLNLGTELASRNRLVESIDAYEAALRVRPDYTEARNNLVLAHMKLGDAAAAVPGRIDASVSHYQSVLRLEPDHFRAHYNLGTVLMDLPERHAEAITHLEAAVRKQPQTVEARVNLGISLADVPARRREAIGHLEFALAKRPDLAPVRELLATLQSSNEK
jgi:protein O-mannosyl-transferase